MPGNGPHAVAVKEGAAEYSDGSTYSKTLLFTASADNQAYTLLDIENYGDPQPLATFGAQNTIPTNSDIAVVGDYLYSFEEDAGGTHRLSVYEIAIDP